MDVFMYIHAGWSAIPTDLPPRVPLSAGRSDVWPKTPTRTEWRVRLEVCPGSRNICIPLETGTDHPPSRQCCPGHRTPAPEGFQRSVPRTGAVLDPLCAPPDISQPTVPSSHGRSSQLPTGVTRQPLPSAAPGSSPFLPGSSSDPLA